MRGQYTFYLIKIFVMYFVLGTYFVEAGPKTEIKLRADLWCPYNCEPKTANEGYVIEVLRAIYGPDWSVDYELFNWPRALEEARKGTINGVIGVARRESEGLIVPEEEIGRSQNCIYKTASNPYVYSGPLSLKNKKTAGIEGYTYGPVFDELIQAKKLNLIMTSGQEPLLKNINKLLTGQVELILEDEGVMRYFLGKEKLNGKIVAAGCDQSPEKIYVGFSNRIPASKDFASTFDVRIRKLRDSGELGAILKKYHISDWK